ncbi:MAG: TIM barrel protein [Akkermansia sp.]
MNVFSCCWNSKNHSDGYAMCQEIVDLGFDHIEISHGIKLTLIPGILKAVDEGLVKATGVHNFCPAPIEVKGDSPDVFQFTSFREWERSRAMNLSKETIDFCHRVQAKYLVLHMGRVHRLEGSSRTRSLERLARAGDIGSIAYARKKNELMRERRKMAPIYYERARVALHELAEYASKYDLMLGVEGRSHYEQIPSEEEMLRLLDEFKDCPNVGYWHDFGHIQRKHNLLMLDHEQFLDSVKAHLIGAHVNDVQWPARDHRAPFAGSRRAGVDFDTLIPKFFTPDMPLTWELSGSNKAEDIKELKKDWDELCTEMKPAKKEGDFQ